MMPSWLEPNTDKKEDDLLVFGYSCKIFRDDEKATYIDQGKHLIPWMGNEDLQIDRYDVRGCLHDLSSVEAAGPYEVEMDEEERLCEEERYLALRTNLSEEELYQEEELKRLRAALAKDGAYHETEFSYDNLDEEVGKPEIPVAEKEEENEPYVAPEGLTVPKTMLAPSTMKIHAIIEKTAGFVIEQGGQMEIIIKMKQGGNPQFAFMELDNPLYPYYKHLIREIKSGKYKVVSPQKEVEEPPDETEEYLHPSLLSGNIENVPEFTVPTINFRRTENCSYSMLVRNLKQKVEEDALRYSPKSELAGNKKANSQKSALSKSETTSAEASASVSSSDTDSESSDSSSATACIVNAPPPAFEPVIATMAEYVARNGVDFETIVKSRDDKRFDFLCPGNEYYSYYVFKRNALVEIYSRSPKPLNHPSLASKVQLQKNLKRPASDLVNTASKVPKGPISFSLRPKAEETGAIDKEKTNLLLGDSDVDEDFVEAALQDGVDRKLKTSKNDKMGTTTTTQEKSKKLTPEEMEKKMVQERIKSRLMAAAREKFLQNRKEKLKEKELQLERKQKAAVFLEMLRKKDVPQSTENDNNESLPKNDQDGSSSREATPPSGAIPISSFPPSPERVVQDVLPVLLPVETIKVSPEVKHVKKRSPEKKHATKTSSREDRGSKRSQRSRSRSPSHRYQGSSTTSYRGRQLPAAYARDRRRSPPRRYDAYNTSRSPQQWSRRK